jgi:hypothetical protein
MSPACAEVETRRPAATVAAKAIFRMLVMTTILSRDAVFMAVVPLGEAVLQQPCREDGRGHGESPASIRDLGEPLRPMTAAGWITA